jgi:hypothetical protein
MNDLEELMTLRAELPPRALEDLGAERDLLLAEARGVASSGTLRPARAGREPRRRRKPRLWPLAALGGGLVIAVAAALTVALLAGSPGSRPGHQTVSGAVLVLDRAATAVLRAHLPVPRPGQYIYVSSVGTGLVMNGGSLSSPAWLATTADQSWLSASGRRDGVLREVNRSSRKLPWGPEPPRQTGPAVGWIPLTGDTCPGTTPPRGSYDFLTTLPTEPAALRAWIYGHKDGQQQPDQQAWTDIGDMLRGTLVPPRLAAALYRVAATIPGVAVVAHATDAAGRSGIALARYDSGSQADAELIFDPSSYQLLGERSVLVHPVRGEGPAGTVTGSSAQLSVSVVSHLPHYHAPRGNYGGGCGQGLRSLGQPTGTAAGSRL